MITKDLLLRKLQANDTTYLEYCYCFAGDPLTSEEVDSFCHALQANTELVTLGLSGNKLDDEAAEKIVEALKVNSSITSLDLSNNRITSSGVGKLLRAFNMNNNIKEIDLSKNPFSPCDFEGWEEDIIIEQSVDQPGGIIKKRDKTKKFKI